MEEKNETINILKGHTCSTCRRGFLRITHWYCEVHTANFHGMHTCRKYEVPVEGSVKRFEAIKNRPIWKEWKPNNGWREL